MVAVGPAAAVIVTEVEWIESQEVLMPRITRLEAVAVEMRVSAPDAVKNEKIIFRLLSIIANAALGSDTPVCKPKHPRIRHPILLEKAPKRHSTTYVNKNKYQGKENGSG